MIFIWILLIIWGSIVAYWYFKYTVFNPYGIADIPKVTRYFWGHLISWFFILTAIISLIMLTRAIGKP